MSPPAICCGTPPTLAMIVPAKPADAEFEALDSPAVDLFSFRNQPPSGRRSNRSESRCSLYSFNEVVEHFGAAAPFPARKYAGAC
jgi:hypothetical protein